VVLITPAQEAPLDQSRHQLLSLTVVGGFLDGQQFKFNRDLNTVIGARGTGKTTVLELVRYAMDALPADPVERMRIEELVLRNLRGGRVDLSVRTKDGMAYIVSRAPGEEPIISTADGTVTEMTVRSGLFRLDVFSQNEVETIADRSLSQLGLLDSFEADAIAELERQVEETRQTLQLNATQLKPLRQRAGQLSDDLKGLPAIEEKLKVYGEQAGDDHDAINQGHALKALRDRENRCLTRAKGQVDELGKASQALTGKLGAGVASLGLDEFAKSPNADAMATVQHELDAAATAVDEGLTWMVERLRTAWSKVAEVEGELNLAHKRQEVEFQHLLEQHKEAQGKASERSGLERLRNELMAKRRDLEQANQEIATLEQRRQALLDQLGDLRDRRFSVRSSIAERINEQVAPNIRVAMAQNGDPRAYRELIESSLRNSNVRQSQVAERVVQAMSPEELVHVVRQQDRQTLRERAGLNDNQAAKLLERLADEDRLTELEAVELIDRPTIELNDNGTWKETAVLSTGQKCTTILPILLIDSDSPLMIDQPEDNLDNRFVFETIVDSIRKVKASRQLIFVTHNPNIPVLGEAEQVFVMDSDGVAGRIRNQGNVDACQHDIVTLLEGGVDAFRRRRDRYGYR
jgi:ABC-type lipoprotein export system ATPase subunit